MPRTRMQPGNPDWILILEEQREKALEKDPTSNWAHSFTRAIGELKRTEETLDYPGQRQIKYIGAKIIDILKKELAKGPLRSDDTLPSSSDNGPALHNQTFGHGFDPAAFSFYHNQTKAQLKGKGRAPIQASASLPNISFAAPPPPPPAPAVNTARCVDVYRPAEGSGESAILIGLYAQCDPLRQKITVDPSLMVMCGEPFANPASPPGGDNVLALVRAGCLEAGTYTLTWKGFLSAERCAIKRGLQRIKIQVDDFAPPGTVRPARQSQSAPVLPAPPRPQQRAAPQHHFVKDYQQCIPKKRKLPQLDDQDMDDIAMLLGVNTGSRPKERTFQHHKAAPKKVATGAFASSYKEAHVKTAAPVADTMPFLFSYLDENNVRVSRRGDADVKIQDQTGLTMYKVEFRSKQARHPVARCIKEATPLARTPPEADGVTEAGWIVADKAPAACSGLSTAGQAKKVKHTARDDLMAGLKEKPKQDPRAMYRFPPGSATGTSTSMPYLSDNATLRPPLASSSGLKRSFSDTAAVPPESTVYKQPVASTSGTGRPPPPPAASLASGPTEISPVRQAATALPALKRSITSSFLLGPAEETVFPPFDPVVLLPGEYHVVLLVDHREVKGVSNIQGTLSAFRVPHEVVNLELGDFLWVARRRMRRGDSYDEIVLAICEKKRKDDLMSSIKSERYRDQKQRIRATGIRKCFYLTEEHELEHETFLKAVMTSTCQTQVVDDFALLVALTPAETISHLMRITTLLQQDPNPRAVIPDELVKPCNIALLQKDLAQKHPDMSYYTTSSSFERISRKSFTVHRIWAKMTSCNSGVSPELCVDLMKQYPTPISFFADLDDKIAHEAREGRFVDNDGLITKKKKLKASDVELHVKNVLDKGYQPRPISGPASERLWHLYTKNTYAEVTNETLSGNFASLCLWSKQVRSGATPTIMERGCIPQRIHER